MFKFDSILGKHDHRMFMDLLKDGEVRSSHRASPCFAVTNNELREHSKEYFDQMKIYPWIKVSRESDLQKWTDKWLEVMVEFPFVKRNLLEFTGYAFRADVPERDSEINKDKYFLVDLTGSRTEAYVVQKLIRLPQEFPGNIRVFGELVKFGYSVEHAWTASLYYNDYSMEYMYLDHHLPASNCDLKWWIDFWKDTSIAQSDGDDAVSTVLGGSHKLNSACTLEAFMHDLKEEDVPQHNVFVYGTLMHDEHNHGVLQEYIHKKKARRAGFSTLTGYAKMYDTGMGFPAVVPSLGAQPAICGEKYLVNNACLAALDRLEGYPDLYNRTTVVLDSGDTAWMYFQQEAKDDYVHIKYGNWKTHRRAANA